MKRNNRYSASVWQGSRRVLFLKYVHRKNDVPKWLNSKAINWSVINFYHRKSRKFVGRIYNNSN